jgi:diguanylate cyclase (GGDEF)-like protein
MTNFVGRHLEEMADLRSTRKKKLVLLCSIVALVTMAGYGVVNVTSQNYLMGSINLLCSAVLIANLWYLQKNSDQHYADLVLSAVLLIQAVIFLLYGDNTPLRLVWLFPIIAAVIFVNEFRIGMILSCAFFTLTVFSFIIAPETNVEAGLAADRFVISLLALTILCNTSSYYYDKVVSYIQSLYREGIEDLAYMDQLTGLANRWSFENWAEAKLQNTKGDKRSITALVFLDIDDFKSINDTYGHDVGDRVLQHFARRLKNNVRSKDRKTDKHDYSIARFAGDEFVLLLYDVNSREDLENILKRICHLFEDTYESSERINKLTISVGVSLFPQDADTLPELTRCADKAMYAAKHGGKNQYRYYGGDYLAPLENIDDSTLMNVTPIKKTNGSCT